MFRHGRGDACGCRGAAHKPGASLIREGAAQRHGFARRRALPTPLAARGVGGASGWRGGGTASLLAVLLLGRSLAQ